MNTTSGKVRLATYEEVKKMMCNNAGGRVVWTGCVSSGTFNTGVEDIDYAVAERFENSSPRSMSSGGTGVAMTNATPTIVCKNCKMYIDDKMTLEVSGSSIIIVNTDSAHSYSTSFKVCAYKYD